MEVFEIKLFLKKFKEADGISDLIRKAIYYYVENVESLYSLEEVVNQIREIKKLISTAKLPGGSLSEEQKMWDRYEEKRKEVMEKDVDSLPSIELDRRAVLREMKDLFAKGNKILKSIPDDSQKNK